MSDDEKKPGLTPARPDPDELALGRPAYMPQIPWRWVILFITTVALAYSGYQVRKGQRTDAMRTRILESYDENLGPLSQRYTAFRQRIERWTMEAAQAGEPERFVDPRLRISGLHAGDGLYLRLTAEQASSPEAIAEASRVMELDALTRCLGIAPTPISGIYEAGNFLAPEWREEVVAERDLMRLRVADERLMRNIEVDVPVIASQLAAQYFLLVIQQGESRRDAPVDVYLWDLREERQLLRTRIQASGILLPVSTRFEGVPQQRRPEGTAAIYSPGAHDCSIAAQLKGLTGDAPVTIENHAALEEHAREQDAAAAARAAAAAEAEAVEGEAVGPGDGPEGSGEGQPEAPEPTVSGDGPAE